MPEEMHVAKLKSGATIVVARAGQPIPSADVLRKELGIVDASIVVPISQSDARPATDEEKAAAAASFDPAARTAKRPAPGA
ncbi:hypothetical protein K6U06_06590 [Acidiferrimicrobium sp. IK]|uniref:hypothetical protein n=1 Tax=Acidiferrimicrobium sp. IK TaxID=2871700 RepID=UPI0021CAF0B4|nr:hypothetical protein [Acidiferrimicrobium sp. IK]MCU4184021.1 hypothetical protein [Acidiferrimicrobium sp. IK]